MEPIILNGECTHYVVYPDGSIFNSKTQLFLKGSIKSDGYLRVGLTLHGKTTKYYVHRLVATAYLENQQQLPCVNHLNNDKLNNCFYNLEWCTQQQNISHKVKQNRQVRGENCHSHKLKEFEVLEIRQKYASENVSIRFLANKYNVDKKLIWCIVKREVWKHI